MSWDQLHLHIHITNVSGNFSGFRAQFEFVKYVTELEYVVCSFVFLLNHPEYKAMVNVSMHQLPQYYPPQRVLMVWIILIMSYTRHILARNKMAPNIWSTMVLK